jgi:hypothetical protein
MKRGFDAAARSVGLELDPEKFCKHYESIFRAREIGGPGETHARVADTSRKYEMKYLGTPVIHAMWPQALVAVKNLRDERPKPIHNFVRRGRGRAHVNCTKSYYDYHFWPTSAPIFLYLLPAGRALF